MSGLHRLDRDLTLWRISGFADLLGIGGLEYSGRWHTAGRNIIYMADSPAGALLETLVHLEVDEEDIPPAFRLMKIVAKAGVGVSMVEDHAGDDIALSRALGDGWLVAGDSALLEVPSVVVPRGVNYLLNPLHADAGLVAVEEIVDGRYDARLFRR